ncbi:MAG: BMP family ABC transporter substrate-binding protein [Clostridiales bacterium]|nr:BMP family ABC transporter substrate-binding protein [Clostridiales bacterium]
MKKFLALALALAMIFALGACAAKNPTTETDLPDTAETDTPELPETGDTEDGEGLKIAIVTSPSGVDDGSFNQDNYEGVLAFIAANAGSTVNPIQEGDINNSVNAVAEIIADYDVIVTPGFQFGGITTLAQENPDKFFILVDSFPANMEDPEGDAPVVDNIYAMQFAEQESGFFAGISAAMETKTGKVAVVNGIAYPSNVNYQFGFEAGVAYANAKLGTEAECVEIASYAGTDVRGIDVGGNYVGDFNDPATGKVVGAALIEQGVDIIFVAAGNSGNGVFTAAKEAKDVFVIGCDVDQFDDGVNGDSNIVLTSGLKNMAINVERQLGAIADGSFKGGNYTLYADTDSTGYVSADGRHQLSEETLAALDEAYQLIKDGEIVPPSNFSEETVENFKGLE